MQTIELVISDEKKDGVFAISLVENPAIEEDFIYLSSQEIELKVIDEEQRIVVGYALIPDKEIPRRVKDKEFNIIFSKETVKQTSELYMKQLNLNNVTVDHAKKIEGATVVESWITEDEKHDKINLYGLKPILGGWAVKMKIYNDKEWQSVKDGKYKGFSIEGKFDGVQEVLNSNKKEIQMSDLVQELKEIIEVGLGKHDVQLATVKQISDSINGAMKNNDVSKQKLLKAKDTTLDAINTATKSIEMFNKTKAQVEAFEKTAKDLGLSLPADVQQLMRSFDRELAIAQQNLKQSQSAYAILK